MRRLFGPGPLLPSLMFALANTGLLYCSVIQETSRQSKCQVTEHFQLAFNSKLSTAVTQSGNCRCKRSSLENEIPEKEIIHHPMTSLRCAVEGVYKSDQTKLATAPRLKCLCHQHHERSQNTPRRTPSPRHSTRTHRPPMSIGRQVPHKRHPSNR